MTGIEFTNVCCGILMLSMSFFVVSGTVMLIVWGIKEIRY